MSLAFVVARVFHVLHSLSRHHWRLSATKSLSCVILASPDHCCWFAVSHCGNLTRVRFPFWRFCPSTSCRRYPWTPVCSDDQAILAREPKFCKHIIPNTMIYLRLQVMARISELGCVSIRSKKNRKYQWFTRLVLGLLLLVSWPDSSAITCTRRFIHNNTLCRYISSIYPVNTIYLHGGRRGKRNYTIFSENVVGSGNHSPLSLVTWGRVFDVVTFLELPSKEEMGIENLLEIAINENSDKFCCYPKVLSLIEFLWVFLAVWRAFWLKLPDSLKFHVWEVFIELPTNKDARQRDTPRARILLLRWRFVSVTREPHLHQTEFFIIDCVVTCKFFIYPWRIMPFPREL